MGPRSWSVGFAGLGVLLLLSGILHVYPGNLSRAPFHYGIDVIVIGGSGLGLLYMATWYRRSGELEEGGLTLLGWIVGASVLFGALGVITLFTGSEEVTRTELLEGLHITLSAGLFSGVVVGTLHQRALRNAQAASRAEARAAALTAEQERLEHLTDLLRHYVLNSVNVIAGHADQLKHSVGSDDEPALEEIERRAQMIATLVENIRQIQSIDVEAVEAELEPAVQKALQELDIPPGISVSPPEESTSVLIEPLHLEEALRLMVAVGTNAIENDEGAIDISWTPDDRAVHLKLEARPATLRPEMAHALEEPQGSEDGLRIHLAQRLIEDFGEITHLEEDGETVRFVVTVSDSRVDQ